MRIDPHAHFKTWRFAQYGKKSPMQVLVEEALDAGVCRIFDMPNIKSPITGRPVISRADVEARLKFARDQGVMQNYSTYIGATPDEGQLTEAIRVVMDDSYLRPFVPGIKAYMGASVGTLGITDKLKQRMVYEVLADNSYDGVLAIHCEDVSKFRDVWDPSDPATHCLARPLEAELSSIGKNLGYAVDSGFEGTVLGCHLTSGLSIELFKDAGRDCGLKVAVEVSPHHTILSMDDAGPLGAFGKTNPPLRPEAERKALLDYAKHETGITMMIGTDYARHPLFDKIRGEYSSGMGLEVYGTLYKGLLYEISSDSSVPNHRVDDLTYGNIVKVFGKKKCRV